MDKLSHAFEVAGKTVGGKARSYFFIAEAGSNFDQDLDTARRLIDIASEAGADAVKFQLFRADVLVPDGKHMRPSKAVELNPDWVPALSHHAKERGIAFLASAFDRESVEVLEGVGVPAHKIASSETTNLPLVDAVAATGKPVFMSTGMCDIVDVQEAVDRCLSVTTRTLPSCSAAPCIRCRPNTRICASQEPLSRHVRRTVGFSDHSLNSLAARCYCLRRKRDRKAFYLRPDRFGARSLLRARARRTGAGHP